MLHRWDFQGRIPDVRAFEKNSFGKREWLTKMKQVRGIAGCSFSEKCYVGGAFKALEQSVYKQLPQHFLKGVSTDERAKRLIELLYKPGSQYLGLDVTSWESSITIDLAKECEVRLVRHMIGALDSTLCEFIVHDMTMKHKLRYRKFVVSGVEGRMSGDLWTSLGNGFTNLMMIKFVCRALGYDPVGVFEGDDGLVRMDGPIPTREMFARLGFDSKIELFNSLGEAGFCKMKFTDNAVQVTDPIERLTKFGWTADIRATGNTLWNLRYTKALSLKAEFPQCPILGPFSDYIIRCCKASGVRLRLIYDEDRMWVAQKIEGASRWLDELSVPPLDARLLVERLYGITVSEQEAVEAEFANLDTVVPVSHPAITDRLPIAWRKSWDWYTGPRDGSF